MCSTRPVGAVGCRLSASRFVAASSFPRSSRTSPASRAVHDHFYFYGRPVHHYIQHIIKHAPPGNLRPAPDRDVDYRPTIKHAPPDNLRPAPDRDVGIIALPLRRILSRERGERYKYLSTPIGSYCKCLSLGPGLGSLSSALTKLISLC